MIDFNRLTSIIIRACSSKHNIGNGSITDNVLFAAVTNHKRGPCHRLHILWNYRQISENNGPREAISAGERVKDKS